MRTRNTEAAGCEKVEILRGTDTQGSLKAECGAKLLRKKIWQTIPHFKHEVMLEEYEMDGTLEITIATIKLKPCSSPDETELTSPDPQ